MTVEEINSEIKKISKLKLKLKDSHYILKCHYFHCCHKNEERTCVGCNMWNLFYNPFELAVWRQNHNVNLIDKIVDLAKKYS